MKKLGVLQLIDSLNTGGAEVLAVNIANSLVSENINSHLCATRLEGKLKKNIDNTIGYLFLDRKKTIDIKAIFKLRKYIKENHISILHAHSTSIFLAFCVKLTCFSLKIFWHDHYGKSQDLNRRPYLALKIMSTCINEIISVNTDLKDWAKKKLLSRNVTFIRNFPFFNNFEEVTILKGQKGYRIIHLAAFREQKNHTVLIRAFSKFIKLNPNWSLHLMGQVGEDDYSKRILNLIKELSLEKHIFVYGSCLDISFILKQADIGILSSNSEGLPIALLEYGLANLPVISTDVGEIKKLIKHLKTGLIVPSNSHLELSEALHLYADNLEFRNKMAQNHYINVKENYSKSKFIEKILNLYFNL